MVELATAGEVVDVVHRHSSMCRTVEEAKRHFGRRCGIMDCWHWCPLCGAYWCHFIDVKDALDKFARVCYGDRTKCLATRAPRTYKERKSFTPVIQIDGRVQRADTPSRGHQPIHGSPIPRH